MLRIEDIQEPGQLLEPFSFDGDPVRIDLSKLNDAMAEFSKGINGELAELKKTTSGVEERGALSVQDGERHRTVIDRIREPAADLWPTYQELVSESITEAIPDINTSVRDLAGDGADITVEEPFPTNQDPARTWQEIYAEIRGQIGRGPPRVP